MHILVAFDKFKGSMSALEACLTAQEAILRTRPTWTVTAAPLSDGGEGFSEILTKAVYGKIERVPVLGPLLEPQKAQIGFADLANLPSAVRTLIKLPGWGQVALLEMAEASGLMQVPPEKRHPAHTSTFGTGQLIAHAADSGAGAIILGIGGSATVDLGLGALEAIGIELVDEEGNLLRHTTPAQWPQILRLRGEAWPHIPPIYIACDVHNPLLGPNGAVRMFGGQKGLKPDEMPAYEKLLGSLAKNDKFVGEIAHRVMITLCRPPRKARDREAVSGATCRRSIRGLRAVCEARLRSSPFRP